MSKEWSDVFVKHFQESLEIEIKARDFQDEYDTKLGSRTKLMLGSGTYRENGIVYKTLTNFYNRKLNAETNHKKNKEKKIKQEIAFERYADCIVYKDFGSNCEAWWQGEQYQDIIIEIENDIKEFSGTFCDLLRNQSKRKVAVFYYNIDQEKNEFIEKKKEKLKHVLTYFSQKGFLESEGTEYLFMFLPDNYAKTNTTFKSNIIALNFRIILSGKKIDVNKTLSMIGVKVG